MQGTEPLFMLSSLSSEAHEVGTGDYLLLHCEKETETQRGELTGPWSCSVGVAEPEFGFRLYYRTPKPCTSLLCPVLSQEIIYKRNLNNHNSAV